MFLILVLFSWVCLYNMKFAKVNDFHRDYISKDSTGAIKGIFVFLVFMSHFVQYYDMTTAFDNPYKMLRKFLGQLVVTMFLFYSGYGIYESFKRKGVDYIKAFPKNRFLKTLLHLDLALIPFIVLRLATGKELTAKKLLLSLIGWDSIGNSNWFMFVILALYILIYLAFILLHKKPILAVLATTALTVVFIIVLKPFKEQYWYSTAICVPLGMIYSYFKEPIEKFVMKNNFCYFAVFAAVAVIFFFTYTKNSNFVFYEVWVVAFTLLIVLVTMKVSFGNKILSWLGNHVFSVYLLQRIPMIIFENIKAISSNRYIYFFVCLAITLIMAELFDLLMKLIDKKLFAPKKLAA